MKPLLVIALLAAALGIARSACDAQTLRGTVSVKATGDAVPSAIVALLDSSGKVVATTLADDDGKFVLAAPAPGRYAARVERVGYRSVTTQQRALAAGATVDVAIPIAADGVSLKAIKVTADRRCVVRPQEGLAAARLWDEARKALQATALTQMAQAAARQAGRRDSRRFTVRIRKFTRILDPETLAERRVEAYEVEGESVTPFVPRDPELLARDGYVTPEMDGGGTYYAPDASVLLSDAFLDAHCFRLQQPARGRRDDLIGLGFEPASRATKTPMGHTGPYADVRGVLWLDRNTAELRYMDYGYTNLQLEVPTNHLGGQMEFRPLPDGRWAVWRWYIRMPQRIRRRVGVDALSATAGEWRVQLAAIEEEGGEVLEVLPPGSGRGAFASLSGVVYDSLRPGPMGGVRVFLSGTSLAAVTAPDGSYRIDSVPPGTYSASVLATRFDTLLLDPPVRQISVSAGDETPADFGVPSARTLWARWCPGVEHADTLGVVLGIVRDTSGRGAAEVLVEVGWSTFAKMGSERLAARPRVAETKSLAGGRYAVCGVPAEARLTIRAGRGKTEQATTELKLAPGDVRRVDLSLVRR